MVTGSFLTALELRNNSNFISPVHSEIRLIEEGILYGSKSGLLDIDLFNTDMTDTAVDTYKTISAISTNNDTFTITAHGYFTGDTIKITSSAILPAPSAILPAPLAISTRYFVVKVDNNTFKLAPTYVDSLNLITVNITTVGSGTIQTKKYLESEQYYDVWKGNLVDRVKTENMNAIIKYFTSLGYTFSRKLNPNTGTTFTWSVAW